MEADHVKSRAKAVERANEAQALQTHQLGASTTRQQTVVSMNTQANIAALIYIGDAIVGLANVLDNIDSNMTFWRNQ